jgi:hypothetical protein
MTQELRDLILTRPSADQIYEVATDQLTPDPNISSWEKVSNFN